MRFLAIDTETTGLSVLKGDRIFEIGIVEIKSKDSKRFLTKSEFHEYIDPEQKLSKEIKEICMVDDSVIEGRPKFKDVCAKIENFIVSEEKTVLIVHNKKFDMGFLDFQFELSGKKKLSSIVMSVDSLIMCKNKYPNKQSYSLDSMCDFANVDRSIRKKEGHGALIDARMLADVFMALFGDLSDSEIEDFASDEKRFFGIKKFDSVVRPRVFSLSEEEDRLHKDFLKKHSFV